MPRPMSDARRMKEAKKLATSNGWVDRDNVEGVFAQEGGSSAEALPRSRRNPTKKDMSWKGDMEVKERKPYKKKTVSKKATSPKKPVASSRKKARPKEVTDTAFEHDAEAGAAGACSSSVAAGSPIVIVTETVRAAAGSGPRKQRTGAQKAAARKTKPLLTKKGAGRKQDTRKPSTKRTSSCGGGAAYSARPRRSSLGALYNMAFQELGMLTGGRYAEIAYHAAGEDSGSAVTMEAAESAGARTMVELKAGNGAAIGGDLNVLAEVAGGENDPFFSLEIIADAAVERREGRAAAAAQTQQ